MVRVPVEQFLDATQSRVTYQGLLAFLAHLSVVIVSTILPKIKPNTQISWHAGLEGVQSKYLARGPPGTTTLRDLEGRCH
jgi:hypothetical protein